MQSYLKIQLQMFDMKNFNMQSYLKIQLQMFDMKNFKVFYTEEKSVSPLASMFLNKSIWFEQFEQRIKRNILASLLEKSSCLFLIKKF